MIGKMVLAAVCATLAPAATNAEDVSFQRDVYPILQTNCIVCHAPHGIGYERSGFSVQSYRTVMKGTKYGAMVNPGSSVTSNLVWLIEHRADSSINMPKVCREMVQEYGRCAIASHSARWLSEQELILIKEWVDQGAKNN